MELLTEKIAYSLAVAEITFNPSTGYNAVLDNFDLGFWLNDSYNTQVRVYNEDYSQVLYDSGLGLIGGSSPINYNLDITLDQALHLQWQYPFYVAIDNVVYDVTAVPIPGAVWLLGAGFVCLAGMRNKFKPR